MVSYSLDFSVGIIRLRIVAKGKEQNENTACWRLFFIVLILEFFWFMCQDVLTRLCIFRRYQRSRHSDFLLLHKMPAELV